MPLVCNTEILKCVSPDAGMCGVSGGPCPSADAGTCCTGNCNSGPGQAPTCCVTEQGACDFSVSGGSCCNYAAGDYDAATGFACCSDPNTCNGSGTPAQCCVPHSATWSNTALCRTDMDCCPPFPCTLNPYMHSWSNCCVAPGDQCTLASDCCNYGNVASLACVANQAGISIKYCCVGPGDECDVGFSRECCSGTCDATGHCTGADAGTCDTVLTGCDVDASTCCGGLTCSSLAGSICCIPLQGGGCTGNECCPAQNIPVDGNINISCNEGVCCVAPHSGCAEDNDCCTGGCAFEPPGNPAGACGQDYGQPCTTSSSGVPSDCLDQQYCTNGICCRPSGALCAYNNLAKSCCSGVCNANGTCM
jgi:hypothetical protein